MASFRWNIKQLIVDHAGKRAVMLVLLRFTSTLTHTFVFTSLTYTTNKLEICLILSMQLMNKAIAGQSALLELLNKVVSITIGIMSLKEYCTYSIGFEFLFE